MGTKKKKPSGLQIARNGNTFIFTWKTHSYSDQDAEYYITGVSKKWTNLGGIKKNTTAKTITINTATTNFSQVSFRVKGKNSAGWSGWAQANLPIAPPPKPALTMTLDSEFKSTVSWSIPVDNASRAIYRQFYYQSELTENGASPSWNSKIYSGTAATGSLPYEEAGWDTEKYSHTRWFRMWTVGPNGTTYGTPVSHVYARSLRASDVKASAVKKTDGTGCDVNVSWITESTAAHPVDKVTVRYLIATPSATIEEKAIDAEGNVMGMVTTLSCPDNANWTALNALGNLAGRRGLSFPIGANIPTDNVIFVQVNTVHDSDSATVEGDPVLVTNGYGPLAKPTNLAVGEVQPSTHRATITVQNPSSITSSFIALYYREDGATFDNRVIGIIPHGQTSATVQLPAWEEGKSFSIGAKTIVGDYTPIEQSSTEVTYYTIINEIMTSEIEWSEGVPLPPSNIVVDKVQNRNDAVQVGWKWSWAEATGAELSWSDHEDAWESTDEPTVYNVNNIHASKWIISGLGIGEWFIRIRLFKDSGDAVTYGTYSSTYRIKLSEAPSTPSLLLTPSTISKNGSTTASWAYISNDGTSQIQAEVKEAHIDGDQITYTQLTPRAIANSAQHLTLKAEDYGWQPGETHNLVVTVHSGSNEESTESAPQLLTVADDIQCTIDSTSLVYTTIPPDPETEGDTESHEYRLTKYPLTVKASGCGAGGTMTYVIERAIDYPMARPDESEYEGFAGETIVLKTQIGEAQVEITPDDIIGNILSAEERTSYSRVYLDDGAVYSLTAIAKDSYEQTVSSEPIIFRVAWEHQAVMPTANVIADETHHVTYITPIQPESGYEEGDVCDIYRLSVDKPELVVPDAEFGVTYVDPYPALGEFGGYRIVYKTYNGDYITEDNNIAWTDYNADEDPDCRHDLFAILIDFDGYQLTLPYNVATSDSWSKDFTETRYLGGTIRGDWNPITSRTTSLTTVVPIQYEPWNVEIVRRLAVYNGICHVRTPDGSSYAANVNVKEEREEKMVRKISKVYLDITRIDSEGFDGVTYDKWAEENL